jgi:hypothetical protein
MVYVYIVPNQQQGVGPCTNQGQHQGQQVICAMPPDLNSGVGGGYFMAVPIAGQQQDNQQQHLVLQTGSITTPEGHAELSSEREPQELPADDRRRDG